MRFEAFRFGYGRGSLDRRLAAILGEGLAGKHDWFFARIGRTRSIRAAIVKITTRTAIFVAAAIGIATSAAIVAPVAAITSAVIGAVRAAVRTTIASALTALR